LRVLGVVLMAAHRYRAPTANGAVLAEPGFDALPGLVEANRKRLDRTDVMIGGLPLRDLRAEARRQLLELAAKESDGRGAIRTAADGPLLLTGHQPELAHPGVWVKNFALNGLARKLGGVPLNLVVDNDTLKSTALHLPRFRDHDPHSVRLERVAFDTFDGAVPYEDRRIITSAVFRAFLPEVFARVFNWGFRPLLADAWPYADPGSGLPLGKQFARIRRLFEREWGCRNEEVSVSGLSETGAFRMFAEHLLLDLPRFRAVYNAALRAYRVANGVRSANHPAPELAEGEAPFWARAASARRERATAASDPHRLRPRALTLTLFARVCLGDFFIHGIGGGKYDEVTDAIIRNYFGIEPPAYQVLSATLHLPLPGFPSTEEDRHRAEHRLRDLHWNPQRHLSPDQRVAPAVRALLTAHATRAAHEPPCADHRARRAWYRELYAITTALRPFVAEQVPGVEAELARVRSEVSANAILQRRDYSWVLFPEQVLRPFLQSFLA
jgi:hypothetical protein